MYSRNCILAEGRSIVFILYSIEPLFCDISSSTHARLLFLALCGMITIMLTTKKKQAVIKKYQEHKTDTGSKNVQVAMLTERIEVLADHLKKHKKDNHSR